MKKNPDLSDYKLIILDMDLTIAIPKNPEFYSQYGGKVVEAISDYFDVSKEIAFDMATFYRQTFGGGEHALYNGDAHHHFDVANKPRNYALLHQKISEIDPTGEFKNQGILKPDIQHLRKTGVTVVVLTSSPDSLARKTLVESGFDSKEDFDAVFAYEANIGPTKIIHGTKAFTDVINKFNCVASETLCVGDSVRHDVEPALTIGADAYLISPAPVKRYKTVPNLETLLKNNKRKPRL